MALLSDDDRAELTKLFAERLDGPVTVHFYTQRASPLAAPAQACQTCRETGALLAELAALSDRIRVATHDLVTEAEEARRQGIERIVQAAGTR